MTSSQLLHAALIKIRDEPKSNHGICYCVSAKHLWANGATPFDKIAVHDEMRRLFKAYPRGTGSTKKFPVHAVGSFHVDHAEQAYRIAHKNGELWTGEYGQHRLDLLDWMIKETAE